MPLTQDERRARLKAFLACAGCSFPRDVADEVTWQSKHYCSPECVRDAIDARDFAEDDEETDCASQEGPQK